MLYFPYYLLYIRYYILYIVDYILDTKHLLPLGAGPAQLRRPAVHGFRHAGHGICILLLAPTSGKTPEDIIKDDVATLSSQDQFRLQLGYAA